MHARSHRFLSGLVIVVFALSANALLDYRLILRNPAELEEIARSALQSIFPDYSPHIDRAPEFFLSERKAVLHDVVFHEKGQAGRTLFRVGTLEAYFRLVPPRLVRLNVVEPEGVLRIDRAGKINFETGGEVSQAPPTLLNDLHVQIDGGQLRVINQFEGQNTDVLLSDLHAELDVTTDLAVKGRGGALLGLVVPAGSVGGAFPKRGLEPDKRFSPLVQGLAFRVEREANGRVRGEVDLTKGELSPQLRAVIPPKFQDDVWDELDPSGTFDARLRVETNDRGARVATTVLPRPAGVRPRGFPTDITDITGRFEVNVFVPWETKQPDFIGVSFDGLTARTNGGTLTARGSVFPGAAGEKVSIFINVLAEELQLGPSFRNALPPKIRAVYDEFDPQGVVQRGRVVIFKGPHQEDPQLSVRVDELAGMLSATYREVPLRLQELTGTFEIREDANVEIHAGGTFQHGGSARVDAHVVKGDLLHVDVRAVDLPLEAPVLDALPERARAIVALFRPRSGRADVRVTVEKPHAAAVAQPMISVRLSDVTVEPVDLPYPITTSGQLSIVPRFPEGARPEDHADPERIEVDIDLTASAPGVVAATAQGSLVVRPGGGPFEGELKVRASQVALDDRLRDALPEKLLTVWKQLSPAGTVRLAEATIYGPERLRVTGEATDVTVRLAEFPLPLRVGAFDLSRDGPLLQLHDVRASSPAAGGSLAGRGTILVAEEGRPIVDVELDARDMPIGEALVGALPPGAARTLLAGMRPEGRADAAVRVVVPPGDGPVRVDGPLHLRGVQAFLHELDEGGALAGLSEEPLRDLTGTITLALPDRLELTAVRGTLRQGKVEATGVIARLPAGPAAAAGSLGGASGVIAPAAATAGPAMDLVVHVGGLVLDERTRTMAGPRAAEVFERFQPEGPVDLQAHVHRTALSPRTSVRLRARARGLTAVASFFPMRVHDVEGEVEIDDGEPVFVDLTARLGDGTLAIRRDRRTETAFPGGGSRGRVFEVDLRDFSRPLDPKARKELEQHLPENGEVRKLLGTLEPEGPLDAHAFIYQPFDERDAMRWLAEVRFGPRNDVGMPARPDFGLQLGARKLRFDGIRGVVRVAGRVAELEKGSVEGEVDLTQLEFNEQTARNVRGRFRLADGVLSFGLPGAPIVGELYGGRLKIVSDYTLQTSQYGGRIGLEDARLQRGMEELGELRTETTNLAPRPYRGTLDAEVEFEGGGRTLGGRERPLDGKGWVLIRDTNLAEVSQLDIFRVIKDSLEGEHSRPFAFERLDIKFGLRPDRLVLDRIALEAPSGFQLVCLDGVMLMDGTLQNVVLTPFDGRSSVAQRFLESAPGISYRIRNKLWEPKVDMIPFSGPIERVLRWMFGGDEAEPAPTEAEAEAED